jgi:hypothetical protein
VCSKTLFTRLWLLLPLDTGIKQPKNVETDTGDKLMPTPWNQKSGKRFKFFDVILTQVHGPLIDSQAQVEK